MFPIQVWFAGFNFVTCFTRRLVDAENNISPVAFYRGRVIILQGSFCKHPQNMTPLLILITLLQTLKNPPFLNSSLSPGTDAQTVRGETKTCRWDWKVGETARGVPLPPPLCSLLTQNREHIPLSQGHHDEGGRRGGETEGGRRKHLENRTWLLLLPQQHFPPLLLPFSSVSLPSLLPYYALRHAAFLFSIFLPFFPPPSPSAPPLYLLSGHLLHVNSLGDDKRLSDDSPVRDCKKKTKKKKKKKKRTTHSSLNHQPLSPRASDRIWCRE